VVVACISEISLEDKPPPILYWVVRSASPSESTHWQWSSRTNYVCFDFSPGLLLHPCHGDCSCRPRLSWIRYHQQNNHKLPFFGMCPFICLYRDFSSLFLTRFHGSEIRIPLSFPSRLSFLRFISISISVPTLLQEVFRFSRDLPHSPPRLFFFSPT